MHTILTKDAQVNIFGTINMKNEVSFDGACAILENGN
jgi:hypothetical protein